MCDKRTCFECYQHVMLIVESHNNSCGKRTHYTCARNIIEMYHPIHNLRLCPYAGCNAYRDKEIYDTHFLFVHAQDHLIPRSIFNAFSYIKNQDTENRLFMHIFYHQVHKNYFSLSSTKIILSKMDLFTIKCSFYSCRN